MGASCSTQRQGNDSTWRTLRWFWSKTGQTLWGTRAWACKVATDGVFQTNKHPVCPYLITDAKTACRIFDTQSIDQFVQRDGVRKIDKGGFMKHSLTGCTGDRWVDMRRRMKRDVFSKVLPITNIPIANRVSKIMQNHFHQAVSDGGKLNLKNVLVPLVAIWICELVLGKTCTASIRNSFIKHWIFLRRPQRERSVRKENFEASRQANSPPTKTHFEHLLEEIEALDIAPGNDCLVAAMKAAGFSELEIKGNILSFLAAGFETTLHITMTTLLMVAHKGSSSRYARTLQAHCVALCQDPHMNRKSIGELKAGKKNSTSGVPLGQAFPRSFSTGSTRLLSRSIVETLIAFPPVWDLPRKAKLRTLCPMLARKALNIDCEQMVECHIDLMCCNKVGPDPVRAWNPMSAIKAKNHLFSFGVGARSCPAGSSALAAVHTFLCAILSQFRLNRETSASDVLDTSYLMPTLNFDGALDVVVEVV